jgi:hypothetical protein
MDPDDIPDAFWEALSHISFEGLGDEWEMLGWRPELPTGLTDVLEVAEPSLSFGRMVHLVGDPATTSVAYAHVVLQHGRLGMRVYFPAQPVPGTMGIAGYVVGFRDLPQVRRMYEVERVLQRYRPVTDERAAYGQAVSAATVQQAMRGLAGLSRFESMPFTLFPLHAA